MVLPYPAEVTTECLEFRGLQKPKTNSELLQSYLEAKEGLEVCRGILRTLNKTYSSDRPLD